MEDLDVDILSARQLPWDLAVSLVLVVCGAGVAAEADVVVLTMGSCRRRCK